ncbi:MAG: class I SAM-dependent methyltransferase [Gemmatimonadaceae bacterium]
MPSDAWLSPASLPPAAAAFDAIAERFDLRYGAWLSVAAQRSAVRARLVAAFPRGSRLIDIGGGTGEDAEFLIRAGRSVQLTDASPAMVRVAEAKLRPLGAPAPRVVPAERLDAFADERDAAGLTPFDGGYSNFAALNCVTSLSDPARGLARLIRPGGKLVLVIFGTCPPGEWLVQLARLDIRSAFRRASRGEVHARLGGREFTVRYHRAADVARAFGPWFRLVERRGIGVFVPPSAAEPAMSRFPRVLAALEAMDRLVSRPLAALGDHVLYELERR